MLYFTLETGEKLVSIRSTSVSSSLSFNSSTVKYPAPFSILISIFNSKPSLSISVIYRSLFKISIPAGDTISQAVTAPEVDLVSLNHSTPTSSFLRTKSLRLRITSMILSLIHGKVEYS
jgi:hypothetical protein